MCGRSSSGRWLRQAGDGVTTGKPGLDLFYNITPSLKLTATFNTDFGETEVDARQINLSRFSVLFPEKRAFFLQGAGVFGFASTGPEPAGGIPLHGADVFPFFSRQIGLFGGNEVPIDAGIKLTGTVGRTDIGVLDVRTGDLPRVEGLVEGKNFFVGRIKQNLFRQSYIGALVTDGNPAPGRSGQTYGADMRLATSRFLGRPQNFVVNAYAVRSVNEGVADARLVVRLLGVLPQRRVGGAGRRARHPGELQAGARLRAARQRAAVPDRAAAATRGPKTSSTSSR